MKNFFKFTSAAAALVMLASCSNDDLFEGQNAGTVAYEQGDLIVNVEPVKGPVSTRAISNEDMTVVNWEKTDYIKVYDGELHKWDRYGFNGSKFVIDGDQDLAEAQYALYPFGYDADSEIGDQFMTDGSVQATHWSKGGKTTATMYIPNILQYREGKLADGTIAYYCALPQWGTVSSTDGKLETNLKYMTAILRIKLANVDPSKVSYLRIRAFKDEALTKEIALSGDFVATLDTENPENTALTERLATSPLYVNLYGVEASNSVVFVPIVPCTNAIIVIDYLTGLGDNFDSPDDDVKSTLKEAVTKKLSQKNYVRGTLYKAKGAEFTVESGKPSDINKVIATAKTQENPEINANVATAATTDDNQIIIPEGTTAEQITLNLKSINTSANVLYIEDENVANPYTGIITVNIAAAATGSNNIVAQTKGATVQFAGKDFTAAPLKAYVKELVIGDGADTDATKVEVAELGTMVEAVSVKANATLSDILTTGDVIVEDGTVGKIGSASCYANNITVTAAKGKTATTGAIYATGNISTSGEGTITFGNLVNKSEDTGEVTLSFAGNTTTGALNLKDSKQAATITFADKAVADGNINAPLAKVTLKSEATFTKNITADYLALNGKAKATGTTITTGKLVIQGTASVKDATATNNVYVKLSEEGEAITGTLTIPADNTEGMQLALHNGYINIVNLTAATNNVALKTSAGYVAIAKVTEGAGDEAAKLVPAAASEWNGKAISDTYASTYVQNQIWTASQLATIDKGLAGIRLRNDINLKGLAWVMPALNTAFNGADHTISGLAATAGETGGAGLFSTAKTGSKILNLTVKDATITSAGKSNVGVLVASAAGAITIQKVTVSATMNVTGDADNVGGLIGVAAGNATIGQAGEATDVAVTLSALAGRYNLGGLIGSAAGADIKKTTVAITNGITFTPETKVPGVEDATNAKAGSIGMFIGNSSAAVTIDAVNPAANDKIKSNRAALGFKLNFNGTAPNINYYFGGKYTEIGLLTADKTLKVGETTVNSKNSDNVYEGTGEDKKSIINWAGNGTSGSNVANVTHGIYVTSKAYAATDVK